VSVPRLVARTGPTRLFTLDVRLRPGAAIELADDPRIVAWLVAGHRRGRGDDLRVDGRSLRRRRPAARVRAGLVAVTDVPVAPAVTVVDHLAAATSRREALDVLERVPRLSGRGDDPAGVLSGGERRLLAWARAMLLRRAVVVLDRAGTGLDADALAWVTDLVVTWRASGTAVLVRVGRDEERRWWTSAPRR
jgi:ABC-type branched-subunit amino acid transport system ATPase component